MAKYCIAGITFEMIPHYEKLRKQAIPYLVNNDEKPAFLVEIPEDILNDLKMDTPYLSKEDLEYMYAGMRFYYKIIKYKGIMLHSSAVVKDGYAYLFSAPSGTGKSTHTSKWVKSFDDAYILNDDKPAIFLRDKAYASGTPFSGKVDLSVNNTVPIKAICFIERSNENTIKKIESKEAIGLILDQTARIPLLKTTDKVLKIIEELVEKVKIYKMGCTLSDDVALFAYNAMSKD